MRNIEPPLILVVDDHPMVREAMVVAALDATAEATVIGYPSMDAALADNHDTEPALLLLDLDLGQGGDFSNLLSALKQFPSARVGIVSATDTREVMRRAKSLGAAGYLAKSAGHSEFQNAISALLAGREVFPDDLNSDDEPADDLMRRLASLTPTQTRVLEGLRSGLLNKQIAYELQVTEATIKAHLTAMFRKLGVTNRTQALVIAQQLDVRAAAGDVSDKRDT